jgi:cell pole-organizing protein PopZ
MTQAAKAQEPSMEEILASIRRIIADDDGKQSATEKAAPPKAAQPKVEPPKIEPPKAEPPKAAPKPAPPPSPQAARPAPAPAKAAPPPAPANAQDDIDALLAGLDAKTTKSEVRPPAPPSAPADDEIFDLTEDMAADEEPDEFTRVEPTDDLEFEEAVAREEHPEPALPKAAPQPSASPQFDPEPNYMQAPIDPRPLLSQTTIAAVDSAFNSLAHTVLSQNARTLEDLVREMLRPMLKNWLDDNLPGLVERIVRAEIERVARGR